MDKLGKFIKWFCSAIAIILIPILINFICLMPTEITANNNDWIGFWGAYLGSIIGGIITLFVLFHTNKLTREIQNQNMGFDLKKETFFRVIQSICEIRQNIDNCYSIESIDIIRINYFTNTMGFESINESMVDDYNRSLVSVTHELKYFVIEHYFKNSDSENLSEYEEDERYMEFQFSDEENKIAIEVSRYILGANDLSNYEKFDPIKNYVRQKAYGRCSEGMELWLISQLSEFINSDKLTELPTINNSSEIKKLYELYIESRDKLVDHINLILKCNKSKLTEDKI